MSVRTTWVLELGSCFVPSSRVADSSFYSLFWSSFGSPVTLLENTRSVPSLVGNRGSFGSSWIFLFFSRVRIELETDFALLPVLRSFVFSGHGCQVACHSPSACDESIACPASESSRSSPVSSKRAQTDPFLASCLVRFLSRLPKLYLWSNPSPSFLWSIDFQPYFEVSSRSQVCFSRPSSFCHSSAS